MLGKNGNGGVCFGRLDHQHIEDYVNVSWVSARVLGRPLKDAVNPRVQRKCGRMGRYDFLAVRCDRVGHK